MDSSRKNRVTVVITGIFVAFYSSFLVAEDSAGPPANSVGDRVADSAEGIQMPAGRLRYVPVSETASGSAEVAEVSVAEVSKPVFEPYLGTITGDNINIRSGPAEIYYAVGKLRKGQQVVIRGERHGKKNWAMIEPTDQCFSYISKKYVEIQDISDVPDLAVLKETTPSTTAPAVPVPSTEVSAASATPADSSAEVSSGKTAVIDSKLAKPTIVPDEKPTARKFLSGAVTGNFIRVRAGSVKVPPVNARQVQTKLNYGTVVQVIGERDDFYKIVPPPGCYFWISLDYIRSIGPVTAEAAKSMRSQVASSISDKNKSEKVTLTQTQLERAEYQELARLFKAEQDKPVLQRELVPVKERLVKLIEDARTPSVKSLANRLMRALARAELARNALKISLSQDERLRVTLEDIDKKVELLVSTRAPAGMKQQENVIQGILSASAVFTATNQNRRFLVLGDDDRILCYAVSGLEGLDLAQWLGKKVSLVGRTKFDAFGKTRVLYVTGIIELPSTKE